MDPIVGYRAVRAADGTLTIRDVPIFVECKRGDHDFDVTWIKAAVDCAMQAELEGYYPPLHVKHHDKIALTDPVRAAGYFRITGTKRIVFKGEPKIAVLADLVITDATVGVDVLQKRLPYRSVEIFNADKPQLNSLALLDHEAPYLELPMLMVSSIIDNVQVATFKSEQRDWPAELSPTEPVFFAREKGGAIVFEDEPKADKADKTDKKDEGTPPKKTQPPAKEGGDSGSGAGVPAPGEGKDEQPMDATSGPAATVVQMIEDGTLTIADLAAITAAIDAIRRKAATSANPDSLSGPAKAAVPGGESMSAMEPNKKTDVSTPADKKDETSVVQMAALQGEVAALKAQGIERDKLQQRKDDVADALKRLDGRPLGAEPEKTLTKFHAEHGAAAFKAYVDSMVTTFAAVPRERGSDAANFAGGMPANASPAALEYTEFGTEAVEKATNFAREWQIQNEKGFVRTSEERYIAINMAGVDKRFVIKKKVAVTG
jgi:hypothetical protein